MTMPSSGPLNMGGTTSPVSVASELGLGLTSTISMNDAAVRSLAGVGGSGTSWSMNSLYGKSNQFPFSFAGGANVDLRTVALANGWNGTSKVVATSNGTIYSNSTGAAALTISGSFPNGVQFINNALIVGRGGDGGAGGAKNTSNTGVAGSPGAGGGLALSVSVAVSITNNSSIGGGGGGGGGGGSWNFNKNAANGGAGGGGGGIGGSNGGARSGNAANGNAGTLVAIGTGGARGGTQGGVGGNGGSYGSVGAAGTPTGGTLSQGNGGAGGAAGACTSGNSNITWLATGTRYGALN